MTETRDSPVTTVTTGELLARFQPLFDNIAATAVEREKDHRLPFDEVERLRTAGYGKLRLPVEHGGLGASFEQYTALQIALGTADSNLPQIFRGHFGFMETRLRQEASPQRDEWFRRIGGGAVVGNAQSEQGNLDRLTLGTTLCRSDEGWRLNGTKYYSTGSIFADWLVVTARVEDQDGDGGLATVAVDARSEGVERIDDWDGFGQQLTGSGTTRLKDVPVAEADIEPGMGAGPCDSYLLAFFQLTLLSALAGVAKAAVRDVTDFTRARTRHLGSPVYATPREDPAVHRVIGEVAGLATAVETMVLSAARSLDRLEGLILAGQATDRDYDDADFGVFHVQSTVIELVLRLTSQAFEVGGASAVGSDLALDRHWRNARTIGSHNPAVFRAQVSGDYLLNGTRPSQIWKDLYQ